GRLPRTGPGGAGRGSAAATGTGRGAGRTRRGRRTLPGRACCPRARRAGLASGGREPILANRDRQGAGGGCTRSLTVAVRQTQQGPHAPRSPKTVTRRVVVWRPCRGVATPRRTGSTP